MRDPEVSFRVQIPDLICSLTPVIPHFIHLKSRTHRFSLVILGLNKEKVAS